MAFREGVERTNRAMIVRPMTYRAGLTPPAGSRYIRALQSMDVPIDWVRRCTWPGGPGRARYVLVPALRMALLEIACLRSSPPGLFSSLWQRRCQAPAELRAKFVTRWVSRPWFSSVFVFGVLSTEPSVYPHVAQPTLSQQYPDKLCLLLNMISQFFGPFYKKDAPFSG